MKTLKDKIPLPEYKVLLLQLMLRLVDRLVDTGIKPNSKRNKILVEVKDAMRRLLREMKRDVRLEDTVESKRDLYLEMYNTGSVPKWILVTIFECLTEETVKLNGRSNQQKRS